MPHRCLFIDPGNISSGFVIWDGKTILVKGNIENNEMLCFIADYRASGVDHFGIEWLSSYGASVGSETFDTCLWAGRFMQCWKSFGESSVHLIPRRDIKLYLTGVTSSKDGHVRRALCDRFGEPGSKAKPNPVYQDGEKGHKMNNHLWAAFAGAVFFYDKNISEEHHYASRVV